MLFLAGPSPGQYSSPYTDREIEDKRIELFAWGLSASFL